MTTLTLDTSFGFGLQACKGQYVSPMTWLPTLSPRETVDLKREYMAVDMADGKQYQTTYYPQAEWAEGQITVPLVPGSLSHLFSWVQDRDGDNQGKWGSLLIDNVRAVKKITDAKVRTATFTCERGAPVSCVLDVAALKYQFGTAVTPSIPVAVPYHFREAEIHLSKKGGVRSQDCAVGGLKFMIDNTMEDLGDALKHQQHGQEPCLANLFGVRCYGEVTRDFVDDALLRDFADGNEATAMLALERGSAVATICIPRLLWISHSIREVGDTHKASKLVEVVQFTALGSIDGLTPPVVMC